MINQAFNRANIPIVLASDNNYVNYLAVMIRSIVLNAYNGNNYDILVLEQNISSHHKSKIISDNAQYNVSIRFIDIQDQLNQYADTFYTKAHFTNLTWSRLFIPKIFTNYRKMLYFDCDMVVMADVAELYYTDIGDNYFGATLDYGFCTDHDMMAYGKDILKLKNPDKYKQAGVLIVNVDKLVSDNMFNKFMRKILELKELKPRFHDQDTINATCNEKIYELNHDWNVLAVALQSDKYDHKKYRSEFNEINIIHYCGGIKPDNFNQDELTSYFWRYAKQTSYYKEIYRKHIIKVIKKQVHTVLNNYLKYKKYQLFDNITFRIANKLNSKKAYYKKLYENGFNDLPLQNMK